MQPSTTPGDWSPPCPSRPPWLRRLLLVVCGLVLGWGVAVALLLLQARAAALDGLDEIDRARGLLSPSELADAEASRPLRTASSHFGDARRAVRNPMVAPARLLPVAGRQLSSLDKLAAAAERSTTVAATTLERGAALLDRDGFSGAARVRLLRDAAELAAEADAALAEVDLGPERALFGPLADARARLATDLSAARSTLRRTSIVAAGFADLLHGPRRYLVLAANNAEMRSGSGMFLSAGILETRRGQLSLREVQRVSDIPRPERPVRLPTEFDERWGWLEPNVDWRHLGVSPRFDLTGRLAARMWAAGVGEPVDGVLAIDVVALRAVLAVTGPVEVDDRVVDAEDVVEFILHDQYAALSDDGSIRSEEQAERRETIGELARAAVEALDDHDWEPVALAEGLAEAARGRHILGWAEAAPEARALQVAGIDGALGEDSIVVGVMNVAGKKLDWFVDVAAELHLRAVESGTAAELRLTITNGTPEDAGAYVLGPNVRTEGLGPGDYRAIVAVTLPGAARVTAFDGAGELVARGTDGPTQVVAAVLNVPRTETRMLTIAFELGPDTTRLVVEPSARVPPISWKTVSDEWDNDAPRVLTWPAGHG